MNARSDEARRSVITNQGAQTDADLHARDDRLGTQIAADAQRDAFQDKADEELRVRMEIASGRYLPNETESLNQMAKCELCFLQNENGLPEKGAREIFTLCAPGGAARNFCSPRGMARSALSLNSLP